MLILEYISFPIESHPTSSSRGSQSAAGNPAGGQTSSHKSSSTTPETGTGTKVKSSSQSASSGTRAAQQTGSGGTTPGTQQSRASSTPASQSQSQPSQSSTQSASSGSQSQSVKTASQPASPSGGTTQPPKASGTGTPASPSGGTTPPKASGTGTPASPSGGTTQPPKASGTGTPASPSGGTTSPKAGSTTPAKTQPAKPASQPKSSSSTTPGSKTEAKSELTKVILDINKSKDTNEFDYKKDGNFRTYTPKPNHVFNKVVKKSLEIWTAKPNDHSLKAVLMGSGRNEKYLGILLKSLNFVLLHKSGKNKPWNDITSKRHDVTKLKFLGESDTELKSTDYTVTIVDLSFAYIFNTGVKCRKVTYCDDEVWNHTDDTNFSEIKSLSLGLASNQFSVTNSSDHSKELITKVTLDISKTESTDYYTFNDQSGVVTFTPKDNHVFSKVFKKKQFGSDKILWESKNDVYATLVMTKVTNNVIFNDGVCVILAILLTDNTFKFFIHNYGNWQDITKDRPDVSNLKFLGDNDVELKSCDYKVNLVDFSFTYIFNDGVNCKNITYNNMPVWTHTDDTKFSEIKSFSLGLASNNFFVKNQSDTTKELVIKHSTTPKSQCQSGSTKPTPVSAPLSSSVSPPKGIPVVVDIQKTETTNEFEYTDESGVVTYKPKDGCLFNKVTDGTKVVWVSKDNVYGTLVRTKITKKVRYLVVLMTNNMFILFHLDNNEWKDITDQKYDIKKLKFFGDNDTEITSSSYDVTIEFLSYQYIFNDGVKCQKVKLGDDDVWKHDDDTNFADIKSFSLGLASNSFFVKNKSNQLKKIEKEFEHITTPASQSHPGKPANTPPSGTTQPPKTSSATSASQSTRSGSKTAQTRSSGTTHAKTTPTSRTS